MFLYYNTPAVKSLSLGNAKRLTSDSVGGYSRGEKHLICYTVLNISIHPHLVYCKPWYWVHGHMIGPYNRSDKAVLPNIIWLNERCLSVCFMWQCFFLAYDVIINSLFHHQRYLYHHFTPTVRVVHFTRMKNVFLSLLSLTWKTKRPRWCWLHWVADIMLWR